METSESMESLSMQVWVKRFAFQLLPQLGLLSMDPEAVKLSESDGSSGSKRLSGSERLSGLLQSSGSLV